MPLVRPRPEICWNLQAIRHQQSVLSKISQKEVPPLGGEGAWQVRNRWAHPHSPDSWAGEAGNWGPMAYPQTHMLSPVPHSLLLGRGSPSVCHRISSLHPPSSPTASHSPFHQLPHSHICFSLLSLHNPLLTHPSHPGFSCPFISPFPEFSPLKLPIQEAGNFKRRSKQGSPIKEALPRAPP